MRPHCSEITRYISGFIRAEVISHDAFIVHKGEAGAGTACKLRTKGRVYVVSNGDVMHFLFNV